MMPKKHRKIRYSCVLLGSLISVFFVSTQFLFAEPLDNPILFDSIQNLLMAIVKTAVYILTPIIVLLIIYTGFLFVQAQGNPAKLTEARTSLVWSVIGAVIVLGAFGIKTIVENTVHNIVD